MPVKQITTPIEPSSPTPQPKKINYAFFVGVVFLVAMAGIGAIGKTIALNRIDSPEAYYAKLATDLRAGGFEAKAREFEVSSPNATEANAVKDVLCGDRLLAEVTAAGKTEWVIMAQASRKFGCIRVIR